MKNEKYDSGNEFDWGLTSEQYAKYRDIYPDVLYQRLRALGVAADGTRWLDLGTGTGVLPQNMYNDNAEIYGADIAAEQIAYAKKRAAENGWDIHYIVSPAESTNLPSGSFDAITAAQCFGYFDREKMRAEIKRLLKADGIFIKVFLEFCYEDEICSRSIELIKQFNPDWAPEKNSFQDVYDDLFDGRVTEEYDCAIPFTRESWHGRMCACRGTLASMDKDIFENWSAAHQKMLLDCPAEFTVKHKLYISFFTGG